MNSDKANLVSDSVGGDLPPALFQHDCDSCVYLGRSILTDGDYAGKYDLYYHPASAEFPGDESVVARHGIDGAYFSGMHFAGPYTDITGEEQPGIAPLVVAKRRAIQRGLIAPLEGEAK